MESNCPKAGRCICVYEFAMGHTLQQDHRESKKTDSYRGHRGYRSRRLRGYPRGIQGNRSQPSKTPAERRVCIGLLLEAFCEIFMFTDFTEFTEFIETVTYIFSLNSKDRERCA